MKAAQSSNTQGSRLLSLPPEIRNIIYRYALVQGRIEIHPPAHNSAEQPALLQVNRRIRNEASRIYYHENVYVWYIWDFNAKAFLKRQASSKARRQAHVKSQIRGRAVWANLLEWIETYFHQRVFGLASAHPLTIYASQAAWRMFELTNSMRV